MAKYEGGCACGAVRYSTNADPVMSGHCQCRKCQLLSGTGHASFAAFPAAVVDVKGKLNYWSYTADSGNTASRGHCPTCGSMVLGKTSGFKDMVAVQLASLDDPAKVTPQMVFYNAKAQPWDSLDTSLQRFPGMPPM
jgi:hypothetical protein